MKSLLPVLFLLLVTGITYAQVTSFSIDQSKINQPLAARLDSLFREDQAARILLAKWMREEIPAKSLDSLKGVVREKDASNLRFTEKILEKYGWLGPQDVGMTGSQALFLVIQHADLPTQQKYYPLIKKAEKDGKILSSNVAILEDRIAVREGREQIYGSQGYADREKKKTFIYPLKDADHLDSLRQTMGMPPMATYVKDWSLSDYKSYLPHARELLKKAK